jgi:hypothetical protein
MGRFGPWPWGGAAPPALALGGPGTVRDRTGAAGSMRPAAPTPRFRSWPTRASRSSTTTRTDTVTDDHTSVIAVAPGVAFEGLGTRAIPPALPPASDRRPLAL